MITSFEEYMGCDNVMQFDFACALSSYVRMNATATTAGGYGASEMKTVTLPALVEALPDWLKTRLKEPGRYVVMMFNDDFTPMDFVVEILESIFFKSQAEADADVQKNVRSYFEQALPYFEKVRQLVPDDSGKWAYELRTIYNAIGQRDKAKELENY